VYKEASLKITRSHRKTSKKKKNISIKRRKNQNLLLKYLTEEKSIPLSENNPV
jgi:hypothetical protein